jgi:1-aminocyclopropane-1-carboxylate deaminase/D-cysteine desulfhydrase-like pyridoxal-dependent ACC family enzyme
MTTPIEKYDGIYVKREDLCFKPPAPPFSKCRGIIEHLKELKSQGITTVGYVETSVSMAGWGLAWVCEQLDMTVVIFDPQYKETPETLKYHREQWRTHKSHVIIEPIKAGMAKVNWYICKKILEKYSNSILLPLGLPFEETISQTALELTNIDINRYKFKSIVVCVGSGTICAGILKGVDKRQYSIDIYGVMTRKGDKDAKRSKIIDKAGIFGYGLFKNNWELSIFDEGWEYAQKSNIPVPFPCHTYYDAKAWEFLMKHRKRIPEPILFWNIGH